MNPFYDELKNMQELIPYLGFDKFRDLQKMATRYENDEERGKRLVSESIRMEEQAEKGQAENDDSEDNDEEDSQQVDELTEIREDLKHLTD